MTGVGAGSARSAIRINRVAHRNTPGFHDQRATPFLSAR